MAIFVKGFLKLPQCIFIAFAMEECGRYPLYEDYFCRCIKYWIKLTRMSHNSLPYMCYKVFRNLDETDHVSWACKVRELIFQYGCGHVLLSEDVGDINHVIKTLKQRL